MNADLRLSACIRGLKIAVREVAMRLRVNLQQKILLLVAGSMSLILLASSYLHSGRIRSLIEKDHYDNAVSQTIAKLIIGK